MNQRALFEPGCETEPRPTATEAPNASRDATSNSPVAKRERHHVTQRVESIEWARIEDDLDQHGSALVPGLMTPAECDTLTALYPRDDLYRSRVVMARHGFGRGEYQYFAYPLPDLVGGLRTALYPHLVALSNRWNAVMHID